MWSDLVLTLYDWMLARILMAHNSPRLKSTTSNLVRSEVTMESNPITELPVIEHLRGNIKWSVPDFESQFINSRPLSR